MSEFGKEYSDNYAHFIAGGRTLDIIKKYEDDKESSFHLTYSVFAKMLTGTEDTATNPDNLSDGWDSSHHFGEGRTTTSALYHQYGDTYVVSVPHTVRGVFNEASQKETASRNYNVAAGYRYEWFTPPDSQPIPYSKVIALREKTLGDQTMPHQVNKIIAAMPPRRP